MSSLILAVLFGVILVFTLWAVLDGNVESVDHKATRLELREIELQRPEYLVGTADDYARRIWNDSTDRPMRRRL